MFGGDEIRFEVFYSMDFLLFFVCDILIVLWWFEINMENFFYEYCKKIVFLCNWRLYCYLYCYL